MSNRKGVKKPLRDKRGRFKKTRKRIAPQEQSKPLRDKKGRFKRKVERPRDDKGRFISRQPRTAKEVFDRYEKIESDIGTTMDMKSELSQDEFLNILRALGMTEHDAYTLWFY